MSTPVSARREVVATLRLAFPLALTQLAQITMSFVDVMMIGRLGPEALAGGVVGATVFFFFLLVCMGVVMAVSPSVAQAHGAADEEEVSRATRQGLWLALLLSAPLLVLFCLALAINIAGIQNLPELTRDVFDRAGPETSSYRTQWALAMWPLRA